MGVKAESNRISPALANLTSGLVGALIGALLGGWISHTSARAIAEDNAKDAQLAELREAYVGFFGATITLLDQMDDAAGTPGRTSVGSMRPNIPGFMSPQDVLYSEVYQSFLKRFWAVTVLEDGREYIVHIGLIRALVPTPSKMLAIRQTIESNGGVSPFGVPTNGNPPTAKDAREHADNIRSRIKEDVATIEHQVMVLRNALRERFGNTVLTSSINDDVAGAVDELRKR